MEWFTWVEGLSFLRQLGLAVAGAAALWSLVFGLRSKRNDNQVGSILDQWLCQRLQYGSYGGLLLTGLAWFALSLVLPAVAHEGITLEPTLAEVTRGLEVSGPWLFAWLLVTVVALTLKAKNNVKFMRRYLIPYSAISLFFASVVISITAAWPDTFDNRSIFYAFHGFHSIFTLGTVLMLDFMFLSAKKSVKLQQHIFPLFPTISAVIWIGLGLDFLSVALVFDEALDLSSRFYLAQTVVAVLIINGVMLAGPITRKIQSLLKDGIDSLPKKWMLWADIAGTISIVSWSTITFVDFFEGLTEVSYWTMIAIYVSVIACGFVGHYFWERLDKHEPLYGKKI